MACTRHAARTRTGRSPPSSSSARSTTSRSTPERRLGEILVEQGVATRVQIARVLAQQHELEYLDLEPSSIEADVVGLLPESLARRYNALPVRMLEDGSLLMAVADPTNVLFYDELRLALGMTMRLGVASIDAIEASISRLSDEVSIEVQERAEEPEAYVDGATVLDLDHETPAVVFVNRAISRALDLGASDIHFTPQEKRLHVRARIDGVAREVTSIAAQQAPAIVGRLKVMGGLDIAERRTPQDGRVAIKHRERTVDVRMAVLPTTHGEKVTLRLLNQAQRARLARSARAVGSQPGGRRARDPAAVRRHRLLRPDRLGQDDDPLRLPAGAQHAGPGRAPRSRIPSSTGPPGSTRSRSIRGRA